MHKRQKKTILHRGFNPLLYLFMVITSRNVLCCEYYYDPLSRETRVRCVDAINLRDELIQLRDNLSRHSFDAIEIYSPITEIPSNVFDNISFKHIYIHNSSDLVRIHKDAFRNGTSQYTQFFTCFQNFESKLRNEPPDYDLYKAVKSLVHLKTLYLSLATGLTHEIPDHTFRPINTEPQTNFRFIEWYGYFTISRIGGWVFYDLPNIEEIVFKYATVERISTYAFRTNETSRYPGANLNITFHSTSLTEDSFEEGVFKIKNRNVRLDLTNNSISIIEEKIFKPFFTENDYNYLILSLNPLNCADIDSFRWLFESRLHLEKRIFKAVCSNGTKLWDLINNPDQSEPSTIATTINDFETITVPEVTEEPETTPVSEFPTTVDIETQPTVPSTLSSTFVTESETTSSSTNCDSYICSPTNPAQTTPSISSHWSAVSITKPSSTAPSPLPTSPSPVSSTPSHSSTTSGSNDQNNDQTISNIKERLHELIVVTEDKHSLNSSEGLKEILNEIQEIQTSLDLIINLEFKRALNLTSSILNVLSNLLNQNNAWIETKIKDRTSIASKILSQIQFTSFFLTCNQNGLNKTVDRIINNNIIADMYRNHDQRIHFQANGSSILIPEEVVLNDNSECGNSSFAALITRLDEYLNESLSTDQNINTQIISFSLMNRTQTTELDQGSKIKFRLKHKTRLQFGDQMVCAFWDFSSMDWSTDGCQLMINESNRDTTVCECNHLTNFAAIMDVGNRETDDPVKSILTIVFCALSLICLILTVCLLLKPKTNNSNTITNRFVRTRTIITLNLAVMLGVVDVFVIFGMDRKSNEFLCKAMSGILLYSLLSSFSWMLLEGYHLYKMTVQVFNSNTKKIYLFMFGYGIPIVIICIGLLVIWIRDEIFFDALIGDYFCWISSKRYPSHIWLLIGPALFAIVFNILIMITLISRMFKSKTNPNANKFRLRLKQIFGVTSLLFNLGITWLSFILYITQTSSYFSYVFIVLNGSQGVFIFIYHLVIYLSKTNIKTSLRLTLSVKWSTKTMHTQLGDN